MSFWLLLPVFFSSLLAAAHWLRADLLPLAICCLVMPFLLLFPKQWAARMVQLFLILMSIEWIRTLAAIAKVRAHIGDDWIRMATILAVVALITAASACVFFTKQLKTRYKL
jgi:hypothetical protein